MKRLFFIIISICALSATYGQTHEQRHPKRTPEEIAHKQTEMMVRELGITDSLQRDTLYKTHLRYARMRFDSNTRAQELERLQAFYAELRHLLTAAQYDMFMNMQITPGPRQPQQMYRFPSQHDAGYPTIHPNGEAQQTPPTPKDHQP